MNNRRRRIKVVKVRPGQKVLIIGVRRHRRRRSQSKTSQVMFDPEGKIIGTTARKPKTLAIIVNSMPSKWYVGSIHQADTHNEIMLPAYCTHSLLKWERTILSSPSLISKV